MIFLYQTRKPLNIFKITEKVKFLPLDYLPKRTITIQHYDCKKTSKYSSQNKISELVTIQDNDQIFFQLKQKQQIGQQKNSVYSIATDGFFQSNFALSVFGEKKLKQVKQYEVSGFKWDGFIVEILPFTENMFILIITNELVMPLYKKLTLQQIKLKMRHSFEEIVSRLMSDNKSDTFDKIAEKIIKYIQKHKQLIRETPDGKQLNFNLLRYAQILQIHSEMIKERSDQEKHKNLPEKMQIEK